MIFMGLTLVNFQKYWLLRVLCTKLQADNTKIELPTLGFQWALIPPHNRKMVVYYYKSAKTQVLLHAAQEHFQSHYTIHAIVMASTNTYSIQGPQVKVSF